MRKEIVHKFMFLLCVVSFTCMQAGERFDIGSYDWAKVYQGDKSLFSYDPVNLENLEMQSDLPSDLDGASASLSSAESNSLVSSPLTLLDIVDQDGSQLSSVADLESVHDLKLSKSAKNRLKKQRQRNNRFLLAQLKSHQDAVNDDLLKKQAEENLKNAVILVGQRKQNFIKNASAVKQLEIESIICLLQGRSVSEVEIGRIKKAYENVFALNAEFHSRNLPAGFFTWGDFWTNVFDALGYVATVSSHSLHDPKTTFISSNLQNHMQTFLDEKNYCIQENFHGFVRHQNDNCLQGSKDMMDEIRMQLKLICEMQVQYVQLKKHYNVVDSVCLKNIEVIKSLYEKSLRP